MNLIESTADLVEFLGCSVPEKKAAFDSLISGLGVTFLLDETTKATVFKANFEKKVILVGQKGVERLWAHAYAYSSSFCGSGWKIQSGGVHIDSQSEAILDEASRMLTWSIRADIALQEDKTAHIEEKPVGLPSPFDYSDDGSVLSLSQSLWCQSLCFILFHELAHVQLGHRRQEGVANVEQEKDADREAARWLLEESQGSERRQLERRLGVATALIYLAVTDVYLPGAHGTDYPPGYDRLFQTLSQYFFEHDAEESEQVWAFVAICMILHIRNKRIPFDKNRLRGAWGPIADMLVNVLATREVI